MEEKKESSGTDKDRLKEILDKYNIDLEKLKEEQEKLARNLEIRDKIDFSLADRIAGIDNVFFKNKIISAVVVLDKDFEVIEQEYSEDKIRFPYINGFRAYRELPCMIEAFNKLGEKPDLVFIRGHGILHPRGLGLASHFSLSTGIPAIGVADSLLMGEVHKEGIFIDSKLSGMMLVAKEGAKPIFISPGDKISLSTSLILTKRFIKEPHKFPEPLRLAKKYAKEVMKEIFKTSQFS